MAVAKKTTSREELRQKAMLDAMRECEPAEKLEEFYKSPEWRKLRKAYRNQHRMCELCLQEGAERSSQITHHIEPISQGGSPLSEANLIALCADCHKDVHNGYPAIIFSLDMLTSKFKQKEGADNDIRWLSSRPFMLPPKRGKTRLAGVDDKNPNGTDRRKIITQCREGESLKLVREPHNHQDSGFVGVYRASGEQIGYIDGKVARYSYLAYDMDHGCEVTATVLEITGKPDNYGCVIEIIREDSNWEEAEQYDKLLKDAQNTKNKAYSLERANPDKAVILFKKTMQLYEKFDQICTQNNIKTWRHTPHPIGRIIHILAKNKKYGECAEQIEKYEQMDDKVGLPKKDIEIVYAVKELEAKDIMKEAKYIEETDSNKSITLYQKAIQLLNEVDHLSEKYGIQRRTRYPVNKVTRILERQGKHKECLDQIKTYELMEDKVGLSKSDKESISKRKAHIIKKRLLSTSDSLHNDF